MNELGEISLRLVVGDDYFGRRGFESEGLGGKQNVEVEAELGAVGRPDLLDSAHSTAPKLNA